MRLTAKSLAKEVATVMADVLVHQRPRWGIMLAHQRQYEGWWKAEMALALESWACRSDLRDQPFGVLCEAKPRDFHLRKGSSAVDLLVAPFAKNKKELATDEKPRVWIELKTRGTWWGYAAKAFGVANGGLRTDLDKWEELHQKGEVVLVCQVTDHDGTENDLLPHDWRTELDAIAKDYERIVERTVGFEIPGATGHVRWARFDCFMVSGG